MKEHSTKHEGKQENPIRYVCLSDFHLGADESILNENNEGNFLASDVMKNLAKCLKSLFADNIKSDGNERPILILNGDIMEFALGKVEDCTKMFEKFMELIMLKGEETFDNAIRFIPGNHDHHIWEMGREDSYKEVLKFDTKTFPIPRHRSDMTLNQKDPSEKSNPGQVLWRKKPVMSELLQVLLKRHGLDDNHFSKHLQIHLSYPCLAILSKDKEGCAIIHHGHFTEGPYSFISNLYPIFSTKKFPATKFPSNIEDLETENFAWIDFLWSTLGRSGGPGVKVKEIYGCVKSPESNEEFFNDISENIKNKYHVPKPLMKLVLKHIVIPALQEKMDPNDRLRQFLHLSWPLIKDDIQLEFVFNWKGILEDKEYTKNKTLLRNFLFKVDRKDFSNEHAPEQPIPLHKMNCNIIDPNTIEISVEKEGSQKTIALRLDEKNEAILELDEDNHIKLIAIDEDNKKNMYYIDTFKKKYPKSFVYGHTHMPSVEELDLGEIEMGIEKLIAVYNTGGWIVNQEKNKKNFGASIVLMDDNLNLVSLMVYKESGDLKEVLIESTNKQSEFLYSYVKGKIDNSLNCWNDLINSTNDAPRKKPESLGGRA